MPSFCTCLSAYNSIYLPFWITNFPGYLPSSLSAYLSFIFLYLCFLFYTPHQHKISISTCLSVIQSICLPVCLYASSSTCPPSPTASASYLNRHIASLYSCLPAYLSIVLPTRLLQQQVFKRYPTRHNLISICLSVCPSLPGVLPISVYFYLTF